METFRLKLLVFCLLVMFFFTYCKEDKGKYPLTDKEIKALLMDIHTSEAALQSVFGRRKDSLRSVYMKNIYQIHRTDSLSVQTLLKKLREDPEKIETIYQQLLDDMVTVPD